MRVTRVARVRRKGVSWGYLIHPADPTATKKEAPRPLLPTRQPCCLQVSSPSDIMEEGDGPIEVPPPAGVEPASCRAGSWQPVNQRVGRRLLGCTTMKQNGPYVLTSAQVKNSKMVEAIGDGRCAVRSAIQAEHLTQNDSPRALSDSEVSQFYAEIVEQILEDAFGKEWEEQSVDVQITPDEDLKLIVLNVVGVSVRQHGKLRRTREAYARLLRAEDPSYWLPVSQFAQVATILNLNVAVWEYWREGDGLGGLRLYECGERVALFVADVTSFRDRVPGTKWIHVYSYERRREQRGE